MVEQVQKEELLIKLKEAMKEEETARNRLHSTQLAISLLSDSSESDDFWIEWELDRERGYLPGEQKLYDECVEKRRRIEEKLNEIK